MATPNYGYEKRQRELARKRKKEDKARARAARKTRLPADAQDVPQEGGAGVDVSPPDAAGADD